MKQFTAQLIGNIGKDARTGITDGRHYCSFSVAESFTTKSDNGEKREYTYWHSVSIWSDKPIGIAKYLVKGQQVMVQGSPRPDSYENQEGKTIHQLRWSIRPMDVMPLGKWIMQKEEAQKATPIEDPLEATVPAGADDLPL